MSESGLWNLRKGADRQVVTGGLFNFDEVPRGLIFPDALIDAGISAFSPLPK